MFTKENSHGLGFCQLKARKGGCIVRISSKNNTSVARLKYCQYGVKHCSINQPIRTDCLITKGYKKVRRLSHLN